MVHSRFQICRAPVVRVPARSEEKVTPTRCHLGLVTTARSRMCSKSSPCFMNISRRPLTELPAFLVHCWHVLFRGCAHAKWCFFGAVHQAWDRQQRLGRRCPRFVVLWNCAGHPILRTLGLIAAVRTKVLTWPSRAVYLTPSWTPEDETCFEVFEPLFRSVIASHAAFNLSQASTLEIMTEGHGQVVREHLARRAAAERRRYSTGKLKAANAGSGMLRLILQFLSDRQANR